MNKTLKNKKYKKKTLKKGGFSSKQLTLAIALCCILSYDYIILEPNGRYQKEKEDKRQGKEPSRKIITYDNKLGLDKESVEALMENEKISKSTLGDPYKVTREGADVLSEFQGKKGGKTTIYIKYYNLIVCEKIDEDGEPISGKIDISEIDSSSSTIHSIIEREISERDIPEREIPGGGKKIKKGGYNLNALHNFVISSSNNGGSIITSSIAIQKDVENLSLIQNVAGAKIRMVSIPDNTDKMRNLLTSDIIEFNFENLLFLSYVWGICKLAVKTIHEIKDIEMDPVLKEGSIINIKKSIGTSDLLMLTY